MKVDLLKELAEDNFGVQQVELEVFVDTLLIYRQARENVKANGSIVLHPRTSQPIENPYLKVQQSSGALLAKMRMIESNRAIAMLDAEETATAPPVVSAAG